MKQLIILILAFVALFLVNSGLKMSFTPFSFKLDYWGRGLGWVLLVISIIIIQSSALREGKKKGYDEAIEIVKQTINEDKK